MKNFLIIAISLCCMICAGCFQAKLDLIITDDGEVYRNWRVMGTAAFTQQIESVRLKNEKRFQNLRVKQIMEGDLRGYEFSLKYPDIESFAQSPSEFYSEHRGKNKGISRHKSWFFDEYDFDFCIAYPPANVPLGATVNQAMFSQVVFNSTIELPYAVDTTNADELLSGGKILKWNLAPLLIHGGEKFMQARFKIWHKDKIALTLAVELIFLTATIFFLIKARAEGSESLVKDFKFKRNVFAGLFVAVALIAAYLLSMPVAFIEADIISMH